MKILVCVRQGLDGEINPFDACAYEEALRIKDAEVVIISMGLTMIAGIIPAKSASKKDPVVALRTE